MTKIRFRLLISALLIVWSPWALGAKISTLTDSPPRFMNKELPASSYVPVETRRFKNARVVWINFDWLREHGIEYPEHGLTPEFEKAVLDAFAYGIPGHGNDPDLFTDETKTFYADRYGGTALGVNFGSGRAASAGAVQIKGIGVTPLVGTGQSQDHGHGGASLEESIREAIWGEVNQNELPFGSNRVIAIIDTGADTHWSDGGTEKRALIIREDPLRPAHFIKAPFYNGTLPTSDVDRTQKAVKQAVDTFKDLVPAEASEPAKVIAHDGFLEYVRRLATEYAASYARRLYHGATSESNYDLRGRFLDFGTETSLPSYQRVQVLGHVQPFGEMNEIKTTLLTSFYNSLAQGDPALKEALPSVQEADQFFDKTYQEALRLEMLRLTGAPPELLSQMAHIPQAERLGDVLTKITKLDQAKPQLLMDKTVPEGLEKTNLGPILEALANAKVVKHEGAEGSGPVIDVSEFKKAVNETAPQLSQDLKDELAEAYSDFILRVQSEAERAGISEQSLQTAMELKCRQLNRPMESLLRPHMLQKDKELIDRYKNGEDRSIIWNEINTQVENNKRTFHDRLPFQVVLEENVDHLSGRIKQKVYDLKTGSTHDVELTDHEIAHAWSEQSAAAPEGRNCEVLYGRLPGLHE